INTAVNAQREVAVSWNANSEPDLAGYEVQRQLGSAAWEHVTVTGTTTTSVLDRSTSKAGGTYRYRVVAFRHSAEVGKLNPSQPSATKTASVPPPPVTTTTTTSTTTTTVRQGDTDDDGNEDEGEGDGSRSGGSTDTGTRTGSSGARSGSGSGSGSTGTTLPSSGKVDLSGFSSLLEQARQSGQSPPPRRGEQQEVDGGFDEKLPFAARSRGGSDDDGAGNEGDDLAIGGEGLSDDGSGRLQSLGFLAGGLLATVLVMHLLWVRSEVRRVEVLEAIAPEPAAEPRPRRRRPVPFTEDP
ncbi:MAG: hypothetical protein M3394_07265, partial [Actinomycetota bacterium]|nr:hypothetical protein [Actinomycetota bacterium]